MSVVLDQKTHQDKSNREIIYRCTRCKNEFDRDELMVKRAVFKQMGEKGKVLRSRVVDWLCPTCLDRDADWQQPKLSGSPGMADTRLNKPEPAHTAQSPLHP